MDPKVEEKLMDFCDEVEKAAVNMGLAKLAASAKELKDAVYMDIMTRGDQD